MSLRNQIFLCHQYFLTEFQFHLKPDKAHNVPDPIREVLKN